MHATSWLWRVASSPKPMSKRAEATARVTCQVAAWLWHARKCRAIARECGLTWSGDLSTPWSGRWRVDVAGCVVSGRSLHTYVVEVKGTTEDLRRERVADAKSPVERLRSKWHHEHFARDHDLWVACGDLKTGWIAHGDVPEHWGVMVFDDAGKATVLRKAPRPQRHELNSAPAQSALVALAEVQTAEGLPRFFNARGVQRHGQPWERLMREGWAEDRLWTRDNDQMEMF